MANQFDKFDPKSTISGKIFWWGGGACLFLFAILSSQIFQTNNAGYVQVKQAAGTGEMSVRTTPGVYLQMFGDIHEYKVSDVYDFNDSGTTINVRFNDASTADISGQIKFRLPVEESKILQLHQDFRSYEAVESDLIRQVVAAALKQSATLFGSEEVYSTRRSDFIALVNAQVQNGIYGTTYTESVVKDEDGNTSLSRKVTVRNDAQGNPIVSEQSTFKRYGIELVQLVVNDIKFDEKTQELIAKRKEADQEKVVAKAKAERAKQDALTAEAQGKANVATAEAEALVKKKTAVIAAEQETAVATQGALRAEQEKLAIIAKGEAEAQAAKLKVAAGLTPLDKATIDKETSIGVAHELANLKFPTTMVISGGEKGGSSSPIEALGLQAMYQLSKTMAADTLTKKEEK